MEDRVTYKNGKGKQTRSFCYISDMIEGLIKLMNLLVVNNQSSGKYVCSKFFFVGIMPLEEEVLVVIRKFSSGNFLDKL